MYLYVELWNVTQKWMDLSKEDRADFFNKAGAGIEQLMNAGVEVTGWAMNDEHTSYRSDYRYMAAWKMTYINLVENLARPVADLSWHDYFSQVNASGNICTRINAYDN